MILDRRSSLPDRRWVTQLAGGAVVFALVVGLVASLTWAFTLVSRAIESAACAERANFQLISCVAAPDGLMWTLVGAVVLACAVGLGVVIGTQLHLSRRLTFTNAD